MPVSSFMLGASCGVLKKVDSGTGKLGYGVTDSCDNHSERLQITKIDLCLTLILA